MSWLSDSARLVVMSVLDKLDKVPVVVVLYVVDLVA